MKIIGVSFIFLCIYHSAFGQEKKASVTVLSVNMFTETIISVPCNDFIRTFNKAIDTSICYSKDSLAAMENFLKRVTYLKKSKDVDTRVRIVFVNGSGKVVDICMDMFDSCVNGRTIKSYPEFRLYLLSLVPKKQRVNSPH
jgi:hypothetical protein